MPQEQVVPLQEPNDDDKTWGLTRGSLCRIQNLAIVVTAPHAVRTRVDDWHPLPGLGEGDHFFSRAEEENDGVSFTQL